MERQARQDLSYLIDSDLFIADILKGRPDTIQPLSSLPRDVIAIGIITFGRDRRRHEQGIQPFLRIADVITLSGSMMRRFADIRGTLRSQGNLLPDMDLLPGATAIATNRRFVTRELRRFDRLQAFGLTLHR